MSGALESSVSFRISALRAEDFAPLFRLDDADVAEGRELESVVARLFADASVSYVHVHNARPGCYSCRIDRA